MSEIAAYVTWLTDLATAPPSPGFITIRQSVQQVIFVDARDGTGVIQPGALVEVAFGGSDDDFIPMTLGDSLTNRAGGKLRLKWAAQSGVEAKILLFGEASSFDYKANPAAALVVGDMGDIIQNLEKLPTTTALLMVSANANRRRLSVKNFGGVTVYLGSAGAAVAQGFPLEPGETWASSDYNGALFGITAAGTGTIRTMEEYKA